MLVKGCGFKSHWNKRDQINLKSSREMHEFKHYYLDKTMTLLKGDTNQIIRQILTSFCTEVEAERSGCVDDGRKSAAHPLIRILRVSRWE